MSKQVQNLDIETFLSSYWQQKPLLIRQAFPHFQCPIDADELAGLSLETEVESRIVMEKGGDKAWQCLYGPFTQEHYASMPESHWTLLVQGCNRYVPELAELLEQFHFLPNWRLDDIMLSYAADQGSVGPHTDNYDVFLLQAWGKRRWQIAEATYTDTDFLPDLDLKILKQFDAQSSWELEPGDMLYLPPGVAHHGVALGECMTISVGFRAPNAAQLLDSLSNCLAEHQQQALSNRFYQDPALPKSEYSGEIDAHALDRARSLLLDFLQRESMQPAWFGQAVTEWGEPPEPLASPLGMDELLNHLGAGGSLRRDEASRFAFHRDQHGVRLFCNGETRQYPLAYLTIIARICERHRLDAGDFARGLNPGTEFEFLLHMLNQGYWYME